MQIGKTFIKEQDTIFLAEGWFITIDKNALFPRGIAEKLNIKYEEYRQILINCNATIYHDYAYKEEHYIFKNEEDIDTAITMLTMITNK